MTQPDQPDQQQAANGPGPAPVVTRNDAEQRYEIRLDGTTAGFVDYRDRDGQRVFVHTEVDDAHAGRGLASRLVGEALTDTRAAGRRVVPVCPYVATFLKRHDEFADLADLPTPEILRWLQQRPS